MAKKEKKRKNGWNIMDKKNPYKEIKSGLVKSI
jgi:hypothetical protein